MVAHLTIIGDKTVPNQISKTRCPVFDELGRKIGEFEPIDGEKGEITFTDKVFFEEKVLKPMGKQDKSLGYSVKRSCADELSAFVNIFGGFFNEVIG